MKTTTISFHCEPSKLAFIGRNGIQPSEIISETAASITIADRGENFAASHFVFQTTTRP